MIFPFEFPIDDNPEVLERVYPFQGCVVEGVRACLVIVFVCNIHYFTLADVEGQVPFLRPGVQTVDVVLKNVDVVARIDFSI